MSAPDAPGALPIHAVTLAAASDQTSSGETASGTPTSSNYETWDVSQSAHYLHCNDDTVRRLAACGKIPARKVGKRWLFDPELLHAYITGQWEPPGDVTRDLASVADSELAIRLFAEAPTDPAARKPKTRKGRPA